MAEPLISVVVPSYRSLRTLAFTLRSVLAQADCPPFEVIVVDSSPSDVSGWIKARFPGVRLLQPADRHYPGAARNLGAQAAEGDLLAFLDADAVAAGGWLATLFCVLGGSTQLAVGGYVANANPATMASVVQHWIEFSEFVPGTPSGPRRHLSTSNLMVSREVFLQAGGFDEAWAMAEDLLFFERLGGDAWFEASSGIQHTHRSRWSEVLAHLQALGYWSGRFRKSRPARGSFLRDLPWLAYLLPVLRVPRILRRMARARAATALQAVPVSPALLLGLLWWADGFRHGLRANALPVIARKNRSNSRTTGD